MSGIGGWLRFLWKIYVFKLHRKKISTRDNFFGFSFQNVFFKGSLRLAHSPGLEVYCIAIINIEEADRLT